MDKENVIKSIINNEFDEDIESRNKQILELDHRIKQTKFFLRQLRYKIVKGYYHRKELLINTVDDDFEAIDNQSRLHPAFRKVIWDLHGSKMKRKRIIKPFYDLKQSDAINTDELRTNIKQDLTTRQFVIGNLSKYNPNINTTHEWTLYVSGTKESPKIDDFIKQISIKLHPSFKPYDLIYIKEAPFVYKSRAWSAFAIEINVFLHNAPTQPLPFKHILKLDDTHSGEDVFGYETIYKIKL